MKPKKCKVCKEQFVPFRPLQLACSHGCAIEYAQKLTAKKAAKEALKQRQELRKAKEKAKTRGDYVREAQTAFNRFIRERDKGLPCISCGRHHQGQIHAGHYRATSVAPSLRFDEFNVHAQCQPCNCHKHGNLIEYRINLIKRIGIEKVDWLEGPHEPKKYSIDELKEIKRKYSKLVKEMK